MKPSTWALKSRLEAFMEAVQTHEPQMFGLSALLTSTMPHVECTIEAFGAAGVRDRVKVIAGGAPVTWQCADTHGANGDAADTSRTVSLMKSILGVN